MTFLSVMLVLLGPLAPPAVDTISPARVWTGGQVVWKKMPRPDRALAAQSLPLDVLYIANLDCRIVERGRLTDCVVASEQANTVDFGRAAVRGARDARIELSPTGAQPGDRVIFSVTLMMSE